MNQILDGNPAYGEPFLAELLNATDGLTARLSLVAQGGERLVENFVGRAEAPASDLLVDDALLFRLECDDHGGKLRKGKGAVKF